MPTAAVTANRSWTELDPGQIMTSADPTPLLMIASTAKFVSGKEGKHEPLKKTFKLAQLWAKDEMRQGHKDLAP